MGKMTTNLPMKPRISNVIVDDDLDMGVHDIRANEVRAARVYSPIDTETWPTEVLDWGDGDPSESILAADRVYPGSATVLTAVEPIEIAVTVKNTGTGVHLGAIQSYVRVDGVDFAECPVLEVNESHTVTLVVGTGESVSVYTTVTNPTDTARLSVSYVTTGRVVGEKIFDLAGKWLSPFIAMHGVPATVVIQGVEMPYADYLKYFPLSPSELKFPADWENGRTRPIVEVYL